MSELKCPFCGQKLGRKNINDRMCSNEKCVSWKGNFYGSEDLWQELIRTRKALEGIKKAVDGFGWGYGNMHLPDYHDGLIIAEIVNEALGQKDSKNDKNKTHL